MNIYRELQLIIHRTKSSEHNGAPGPENSCRKIFHGPAGELPGQETLIIDRLGNLILVITYKALLSQELTELAALLKGEFPGCFIRIQERGTGPVRDLYLSQEMPERMTVRENGLTYYIHPRRGQNLGFFPDMVCGREAVRRYTADLTVPCRILNLFAYTCAFSVAALSAADGRVDNWDMNRNSLSIGRENHRLNGLTAREKDARYFGSDIFKSMGKIRRNGPYHLVITDPPPFQGSHFSWRKDYPRLLRRMGEWLAPGGAALVCLNAPDCSWEEFETLLKDHLTGSFESREPVRPPEAYTGRYHDRGLKTFLLTGWTGGGENSAASGSSIEGTRVKS